MPSGAIDVIFDLGGAAQSLVVDRHRVELFREAWVSGMQRGPITFQKGSPFEFVGVRFRAGGALPFLGVPLSELTDRVVALDALWGSRVDEVRERLAAAPRAEVRLAALETVLAERLPPDDHHGRLVRAGVDLQFRLSTDLSISGLARQLGVSHRRLIETFRREVGVNPKMLHRVLRLQRAIMLEDHSPPLSWAAIALRSGYYDQAHLVNEFRELAGMTPETYRRRRFEYPGYVLCDANGSGSPALHPRTARAA